MPSWNLLKHRASKKAEVHQVQNSSIIPFGWDRHMEFRLHPSCPTAPSLMYSNINTDLEKISLQLQCHKRAVFTSYKSQPAWPELDLKLQATEQNQSTSHRRQTHSLKTMGVKNMGGNPSFQLAFRISRKFCLDVPDRVCFRWVKTHRKVFLG